MKITSNLFRKNSEAVNSAHLLKDGKFLRGTEMVVATKVLRRTGHALRWATGFNILAAQRNNYLGIHDIITQLTRCLPE